MIIEFTLNGEKYKKNADPGKRLVDFLREDMGLTGTKAADNSRIELDAGFCRSAALCLRRLPQKARQVLLR